MKRTMTLLALTICLTFAQTSFAASMKPPSSFCAEANLGALGNAYITMAPKAASGNIKMADGQLKFYSVNAVVWVKNANFHIPCSGTGYMKNQVFIFTLTGSAALPESNPVSLGHTYMEGAWNVLTNGGVVALKVAEMPQTATVSLLGVPCSTVSTPTIP
jgi:hypothetical protein